MSEWKEYILGDIFKVKHGFAFKGTYITTVQNNKILVTPGNFHIGGGFKSDKFKYLNSDEFPKEYILSPGDIVVTMTDLSKDSDTLGYSAKIPYTNNVHYLHNQRIGLLKFKNNNFEPDFIYWYLRTKEYQAYIVGSASGTSIMHTSPSRIEEFVGLLPSSIDEQRAIASILSSLDDKIVLLNRQNATLEKMAETLFRQWFVEEAKEEWEETTLYESIKLIGGGTPKTSNDNYWNGKIKWLSCGDIATNHKTIITTSEKTISEEGIANSSAKLLPKFATIISARGTVGKYCILSERMAFSQSNYGILPKYDNCFFFTYLLIAFSVDELQSAAYGSVFDTITTNTFKGITLKMPSINEVIQFEKVVYPYFMKILNNQSQIRTLTALRDTLLPKLMSGEVRVGV
ncbi:restriction endonuclease subunit S [Alistipes sp. ZOR0009]|uniref:restriction endonuclease subunit S n=1 Tax=Alistipes sp. ZOR0009 TaxID=1339253 RepID=UPI000645D173|nr:restriction endonuclease subunit S [Alistipes sp. ZOR0009]